MSNQIIYCPSVLNGEPNLSYSAFVNDEPELDNFSFRDIFKKKDTGASTQSQSSEKDDSGGSGSLASILTGVVGMLGGLAPVLPALGVGSKSRIAETNATAAVYNAQTQSILAQQKADSEKEKIYIMAGIGIILLVIIIFALKT